MASGCPVRKLTPAGETSAGPELARVRDVHGDRWVVGSFDVARQLLRHPDGTRQAGFAADRISTDRMRAPILYLEGEPHRAQRRAAARFFAPKVIEGYRPMIDELSGRLLGRLDPHRPTDLTRLSMTLAVQVTAQVVGLTDSSTRGMSRRLGLFFRGDPTAADRSPRTLLRAALTLGTLAAFHNADVKPAIRARRRRPREDVISQLLALGFTDLEILTECVTYAAAGMATTREFVTVAAWHLLDDPALLTRYRAGSREERQALLEEILRVEPVVGFLRRRTTAPLTLETADGSVTLDPGSRVEVNLRTVNADASVAGAEPDAICSGRALPPGVPGVAMSFGDGHHRCPGGPLAILESEIFLSRLFEQDVVADGPPRVRWNPVSQGYDLDRFRLRLRARAGGEPLDQPRAGGEPLDER